MKSYREFEESIRSLRPVSGTDPKLVKEKPYPGDVLRDHGFQHAIGDAGNAIPGQYKKIHGNEIHHTQMLPSTPAEGGKVYHEIEKNGRIVKRHTVNSENLDSHLKSLFSKEKSRKR
jgi:hypothetical protein